MGGEELEIKLNSAGLSLAKGKEGDIEFVCSYAAYTLMCLFGGKLNSWSIFFAVNFLVRKTF